MSGVEGQSHITLMVRDLDRMETVLTAVPDARKVCDSGARANSIAPERFFFIGSEQPVQIGIVQGCGEAPRD